MLYFKFYTNFAAEIRFPFDTAKVGHFCDTCKKLPQSEAVTFKLVILRMNALPLKENLEKYTDIDHCPVRNVISHISGKWPILILCILAENETTRFNAISKAIPDISSKVLSNTLKSLEADGLVERILYAEIPPRVEYSLTDLGKSLMPILGNLIGWALRHFDNFKQ